METKPIKTQIEELEREVIKKKEMYNRAVNLKRKSRFRFFQEIKELKAKLKTLKECKKMFDDYNEKLKEELDKINIKTASGRNRLPSLVLGEVSEIIDKLSGLKEEENWLKWERKIKRRKK